MEGKKIQKTVELGQNYLLVKFDDGEIGFLQVITPDGLEEELVELLEDEPEKAESKSSKKEEKSASKKENTPVDDDSYTWKDLLGMDHKELKEFVDENELDTDPDDFDEEDDDEVMEFRKEIAEEIGVEVPEEKEGKEELTKTGGEVKDDDYTWDDLKAMDFDELEELCEEQELDIDPDDYDEEEEDKLRKAIADELGIDAPSKPKKKKK